MNVKLRKIEIPLYSLLDLILNDSSFKILPHQICNITHITLYEQ